MSRGDPSGVVTSSALRAQLVICLVALLFFAVMEVFSIRVGAAWWVVAAWPLFGVLCVVGLWQSVTCSVRFDSSGIRARPYPWRPVSMPWAEIEGFQGRPRGLYAVTRTTRTPLLLLPFGRYPPQVRARKAAVETLEHARAVHAH